MNAETWSVIRTVFGRAVDLPRNQQRDYVVANCANTAIREEILGLLAVHDDTSDFLEWSVPDQVLPVLMLPDPLIGQRISDFQILSRIGVGGMGIVYKARQARPSRTVALKLLLPDRMTDRFRQRFEREAETLAGLQHPGIARIIACGHADLGYGTQPWLAMEFVGGRPLHHYCREHQLTIQQKLEILIRICDAVQHAHDRGIVHRDLKPSNILVEHHSNANDGRDIHVPVVVDFGIARSAQAHGQGVTLTSTGDLLGSLSYMSPESLSEHASDIDARSDVYALGTVGYELLTGKLPFDLQNASVHEVIRRMQVEDHEPLRKREPGLHKDLELVFNRALAREPQYRYLSVRQFAADLRRYLSGLPVTARPDSVLYRLRHFTRRYRTLVGVVSSAVTMLVVGLVFTAREAEKARMAAERSAYEASKASAINSFMTNDFLMKLLAAASSTQDGQRVPVSELVAQASASIPQQFASNPLAEAAVRNEVGTLHYNIGEFRLAAEQYNAAMRIQTALLGEMHEDTLKAVNNLGQCHMNLGEAAAAEPLMRRAVEGRQNLLGESHPQTLISMNNLAELLKGSGKAEAAEELLRTVVSRQSQSLGSSHPDTLTSTANLATLLASRGQISQALSMHQSVFEQSQQTLGADHVLTLRAGSRFSQTLLKAGRAEEARAVLEPVLGRFERTLGPASGDTLITRRLLARIYNSLDQTTLAIEELQKALESAESGQQKNLANKIRAELRKMQEAVPVQSQRSAGRG